MTLRGGDPVMAGARMVVAAREIARRAGGAASCGCWELLEPAGFSRPPAGAVFSLHVRHPAYTGVLDIEGACVAEFETIARQEGGGKLLATDLVMDEPEVRFGGSALEALRLALEDVSLLAAAQGGTDGVGGADGVGGTAEDGGGGAEEEVVVHEVVVDRPVDAVAPSKRGVTTGVVTVREDGAIEDWFVPHTSLACNAE